MAATSDSTPSLVDRAHDDMHRRITDGAMEEGARLVIDRLARELGMSLIPVREALSRLQAEGLVVAERNKGFRVAPRPSLAELRRLFEARLVLESGAVELALADGAPVATDGLRGINAEIAAGSYGTTFEGFRDFVALNERFHVALMALAGNPHLSDAYRRLAYHQQITRPTFGIGVPDLASILAEHEAIIAALASGDAETARRTVRDHIAGGRDRLAATLG